MAKVTVYKLTNKDWTTYGGCKWGPGVEHRVSGKGSLCTDGWIHAHLTPELAVLLNPIHGNFPDPVLWEAVGCGKRRYDGELKVGFSRLKTVKRIKLPKISVEGRVRFGILCAKEVCKDIDWNVWADAWLSGKDRTAAASKAAWTAAAASKAAWTASKAASKAAWAASKAASKAAWAAADASWAAWAAAASWTAWSAAWAAGTAGVATREGYIDLISIASRVFKED